MWVPDSSASTNSSVWCWDTADALSPPLTVWIRSRGCVPALQCIITKPEAWVGSSHSVTVNSAMQAGSVRAALAYSPECGAGRFRWQCPQLPTSTLGPFRRHKTKPNYHSWKDLKLHCEWNSCPVFSVSRSELLLIQVSPATMLWVFL